MVINLEQLQQLLYRTDDYIRNYFQEDVNIDEDFYLTIADDIFDVNKEHKTAVGSVKDDWESLLLLLKDKERPFTSVDLERISTILKVISEKINPS